MRYKATATFLLLFVTCFHITKSSISLNYYHYSEGILYRAIPRITFKGNGRIISLFNMNDYTLIIIKKI